MYVFSAYTDVNLGIDIVFQALSLFKIAILLLIVIASVTIIFMLSSFALSYTFLISMGRTRWKNKCS